MTINRTVRLALFLSFLFLLGACSNKKEVLIYNGDITGSTVTIDDEIIEIDTSGSFTTVKLDPGTHTIESNGELPSTIEVVDDCLIASGETEFAIFPTLYTADTGSSNLRLGVTPESAIVIGDSVVIYAYAEDQTQLVENMAFIMKTYENCATCPPVAAKLKVLEKKGNVYPKEWDYHISNVPDEIRITSGNEAKKTVLVEYITLQLYARFSEEMIYDDIESPGKLESSRDLIKLCTG